MLRISEKAIDDFLDYLFSISNLATFVLRQSSRLWDPDDERILEVAVQCNAMIVTQNRTPAEFLRMLRESQ
jgi:predicted nucleic acid-binding protein